MEPRDSTKSTSSVDSKGNVIHHGDLRRKGGVFGGWKNKFAVVEDSDFVIYSDQKMKKCEYRVSLESGVQVATKPPKSEKKSPYLEITHVDPKKKKAKSLVLKTKDLEDQKAWLDSLQSIISQGNVDHKVFGVSLQELSKKENAYDLELGVPVLVRKSVEFLSQGDRLNEEGVFRLAGNVERCNQLKDLFNAGKNPDFDVKEDVNVVTALLKQFFGNLPEPLLLTSNYDTLLGASRESSEKLKEILTETINSLPIENKVLLKYLCDFLAFVSQRSQINKMGIKNLATVFAPNILKGKNQDPMKLMAESDLINRTVENLIEHKDEIFQVQPQAQAQPQSQEPEGSGEKPMEVEPESSQGN